MKLAEPVAELNPLDDLGQAVLAVEFAPFLLRRHRTKRTKGCLSRKTGLAMAFKLMVVSRGVV